MAESRQWKPERCPGCGTLRLDRARRRFYERLLLVRRVYLCYACGRRVKIWRVRPAAS